MHVSSSYQYGRCMHVINNSVSEHWSQSNDTAALEIFSNNLWNQLNNIIRVTDETESTPDWCQQFNIAPSCCCCFTDVCDDIFKLDKLLALIKYSIANREIAIRTIGAVIECDTMPSEQVILACHTHTTCSYTLHSFNLISVYANSYREKWSDCTIVVMQVQPEFLECNEIVSILIFGCTPKISQALLSSLTAIVINMRSDKSLCLCYYFAKFCIRFCFFFLNASEWPLEYEPILCFFLIPDKLRLQCKNIKNKTFKFASMKFVLGVHCCYETRKVHKMKRERLIMKNCNYMRYDIMPWHLAWILSKRKIIILWNETEKRCFDLAI